MKLIVGLGNPGSRFQNTRHNVGFDAIDALSNKLNADKYELCKKADALYTWTIINGEQFEFIKPQTFMNGSGKSVAYILSKHRELEIDDIYVIHDDLDIKLGEFKIQLGKGPKDHNGILSIEKEIGSKNFYRVRVGVENRTDQKIPGEDYVLMKFQKEESDVVNSTINRLVDVLINQLK